MELLELKELLSECWNIETCSPGLKDKWSEDNPSIGQCAITALIVNDYFDGKIMRCMSTSGSHYYNIIDDKIIDLTKEQFLGEIPLYEEGQERTREYLLSNEDTKKRYLMLKKSLLNIIGYKKNNFKICFNDGKENTFMSEEVAEDFRKLLRSCSRQLYVDKKGMVLQKKKK